MNYYIYPHTDTWEKAKVHQTAELFSVPLLPVQSGRNEGDLPSEFSFMEIEEPRLILSSVKQSEDKKDIIFRVYNPTAERIISKIRFFTDIEEAARVSIEELPIESIPFNQNILSLVVHRKKVMTIKVKLKNRK